MANPKKNSQSRALDNNPGKRKDTSVKAPPGVPDMPAWLTGRAAEEWRLVVPVLDSMGTLSRIDRAAVADYCRCVARLEQLESLIDDAGVTKKGVNRSQPGLDANGKNQGGGDVKNPAFALVRQYRQAMQKWCEILGITPGRRDATTPEPDDDPDGLLD